MSADRSDEVVDRFLSKDSEHPTFLLLEVLRKDIYYVENLRKLLLYTWKQILKSSHQFEAVQETENSASNFSGQMPENAFAIMISRLLSQARRIWPSAMVSIARMASAFVDSYVARKGQDPKNLDPAIHARLCQLNNRVFRLLALPASIDPLNSMVHNWSAQKVLLELAGQYGPPLLLDKDSYRAVIRVHAASKKSARESQVSALRLRSWPPWRTEKDGMDAQRSPDEDLSRVLLATSRSNEAGYREIPFDVAMKVLGGQDLDGTPTIHVRKVVKWRAERPGKPYSDLDKKLDPGLWAARIEATRDVREAWRAFVSFRDVGGVPNPTIYLAMFRKLNFDLAREGRNAKYTAVPGDGLEVLPVPDDNVSAFYKTHTQPPTGDTLYRNMISSGVVPSGQLLTFLVRHARTPSRGVEYLRDSRLRSEALNYLTGGHNTSISPKKPFPDVLKDVSGPTLSAYIELICRFTPRAVLTVSARAKTYNLSVATTDYPQSETPLVASSNRQWCIQELEKSSFPRLRDPLHHAARILNGEQSKFRPAWYSLFEALSRRSVVLSRKHIGGPKNDELAWSFTRTALCNFHSCGLELDPYGFILICNTFFKFGEAAHHVFEEYEAPLTEGAQILKEEFAKLSRREESRYWMPKLLHSIKSVTLHAYVRCMGLVGDLDEIISVLQWMVQNRQELEENNRQSANGAKMLARTLVAARISCYGTAFEERAAELVRQVDGWRWPDDSELDTYSGASNADRESGSESGHSDGSVEQERS